MADELSPLKHELKSLVDRFEKIEAPVVEKLHEVENAVVSQFHTRVTDIEIAIRADLLKLENRFSDLERRIEELEAKAHFIAIKSQVVETEPVIHPASE